MIPNHLVGICTVTVSPIADANGKKYCGMPVNMIMLDKYISAYRNVK